MPKININSLEWKGGTGYPVPFRVTAEGRTRKRLGVAAGVTQYGVNLTRLEPGAQSALRHWHEQEDEFIYVLQGALTLVEDGGETLLETGDAAGFKAGVPNGHHLVNASGQPAVYLEIGTRSPLERVHYPDNDLTAHKDTNGYTFTRKDGTSYEEDTHE